MKHKVYIQSTSYHGIFNHLSEENGVIRRESEIIFNEIEFIYHSFTIPLNSSPKQNVRFQDCTFVDIRGEKKTVTFQASQPRSVFIANCEFDVLVIENCRKTSLENCKAQEIKIREVQDFDFQNTEAKTLLIENSKRVNQNAIAFASSMYNKIEIRNVELSADLILLKPY